VASTSIGSQEKFFAAACISQIHSWPSKVRSLAIWPDSITDTRKPSDKANKIPTFLHPNAPKAEAFWRLFQGSNTCIPS
jgi:hypothetical protein